MSLVGFKARNHRQQVGKRGPNPKVDERQTSPEVFDPLHERFRFTIDAAALPRNAKLERFWTPDDDALSRSWARERVWCNPPYSDIEPWIDKAWHEWGKLGGCPLIVMLVPANRTEQGWWQRAVEPGRLSGDLRVEFLPGRLRFIAFDADEIKPNERPPFGCCLLIWGATGIAPRVHTPGRKQASA
jgi:phage N-6-adenine-methyltransferase